MKAFSIPKPNGAYKVGVSEKKLALGNGEHLSVRIWYPSNPELNLKPAPYHPHPVKELKGMFNMSSFLFFFLRYIKTDAYENAPFINGNSTFPAIIYSHGAVSKYIENTALFLELASRGIIVAAVNHSFSFKKYDIDKKLLKPDADSIAKLFDELCQKVLPDQVTEQKMVMKLLTDLNHEPEGLFFQRLATAKFGLMGHSFGGAVCTQTSLEISNIFAVVNLDGPVCYPRAKLIGVPYFYLSSFSPDLSDEELKRKRTIPDFYRAIKQNELNSLKSFLENKTDKVCLRLITAGHLDLTDTPFVLPFLTTKGYDKLTGHQIKCSLVVQFLLQSYNQQDIHLQTDNNLLENLW